MLVQHLIWQDSIIKTINLSVEENCKELHKCVSDVDILVNNAGFGVFGDFSKTNLDKELDMIDLNVKTVHTLTKLFLKDFKKKDSGYILNVASSAAFSPGPLMASYYASKAYVLRLTEAIYEELRREKSNVSVSCLCPGPVDTNFNTVAGVSFSVKALQSYDVAKYAIDKMFKKKLLIIPGTLMKLNYIFNRFMPLKPLLRIAYNIQRSKEK